MVEHPLPDQDTLRHLINDYELTEKQAQFCLLLLSGVKGIDAVMQVYNYTSLPNSYNQLAALSKNPRVDRALRSMGFNLRDTQEKQAFAIIRGFYEIGFNQDVSVKDRLTALRELARYNPVLLQWQQEMQPRSVRIPY